MWTSAWKCLQKNTSAFSMLRRRKHDIKIANTWKIWFILFSCHQIFCKDIFETYEIRESFPHIVNFNYYREKSIKEIKYTMQTSMQAKLSIKKLKRISSV